MAVDFQDSYRAYLDAYSIPSPITALDAALGQAVQNVQRDSRFQIRKTSQGRYALLGPGDFFDESHRKEYMEAIQAFFAGDLIEALEKRQAFIDSFVVAP